MFLDLLNDSEHSRFRGEAYVEFETRDDAETAAKHYNNRMMGRRYIEVFISRPSELQSVLDASVASSHNRGNPVPKYSTAPPPRSMGGDGFVVRMRGIPWSTKEHDIHDFFEGMTIVPNGVYLTLDNLGRPGGEAFVEFTDERNMELAMKRDKASIGNRYVELFRATRADISNMSDLGEHKRKERRRDRDYDDDRRDDRRGRGGGRGGRGGRYRDDDDYYRGHERYDSRDDYRGPSREPRDSYSRGGGGGRDSYYDDRDYRDSRGGEPRRDDYYADSGRRDPYGSSSSAPNYGAYQSNQYSAPAQPATSAYPGQSGLPPSVLSALLANTLGQSAGQPAPNLNALLSGWAATQTGGAAVPAPNAYNYPTQQGNQPGMYRNPYS